MESRQTIKAEIEKQLNEKDPEILRGLSADKRKRLIETVAITFIKEHKGPLPSPQALNDYNEAVPNGADRIVTIFEEQARHRMELEKIAVTSQLRQSGRGQWFALTIGIFALSCSTFTIYQGHEWPGALLGVGGITGLVVAFLKGKDYQQENLQEKKPVKQN